MNRKIIEIIKQHTKEVLPSAIELRHTIHSEPELGHKEHKTRNKILDYLKGLPLEIRKPLLETDVVADLDTYKKRIILRADIDALPLKENTGVGWTSKDPGIMHACGHDGHTAILAGTAKVLGSMKEHLRCSIRFVFQPAEELSCAGADLVAKGVCENVDAVFALHGWPGIPEGAVSSRKGALFAAAGHFKVKFTGKGGHGAMPEKARNPIIPAADFAKNLAEIHRRENHLDGSVISVCSIHSGSSSNIIPNEAEVQGTMRYLSKERGDILEEIIRSQAERIADDGGVQFRFSCERKYSIPVTNTEYGYNLVKKSTEYLDGTKFIEAEKPSMGAEDFAFYLDGREGAMFWLGLGEKWHAVHTPFFDFNDDVIETGINMLCLIALSAK